MGLLFICSALSILPPLLPWLGRSSSVLGQGLREGDALCDADGCFVVHFDQKIFLDSWRSCKYKGGDLATIKHRKDAEAISKLFSTLDLRQPRSKVEVWIGLQRQPRQCSDTHPLRGFSWTTGDRDTAYTNWHSKDSAGMCSVPRCVAMGYSTQEQGDNFKWLVGPCSNQVDGYLCRYSYKGMCGALWSEGAGGALYTTPFDLVSSLLTHVPPGSVANLPCPADDQLVLCMVMEDGSVGWSRQPPLCSGPSVSHSSCAQDNGGCEHFCRTVGGLPSCECAEGYHLRTDGQTCEPPGACLGYPCEFECLPLLGGYRCACPDGYMLAPDGHACLDVDECLLDSCEELCKNAPGTFECQCHDGYLPDSRGRCEDIDECKSSPCEQSCENTEGSYSCHCHLGFSSDSDEPSLCQDVDECQIVGICEQMCVNYEGGFECYCEEGYELMSDHFSCQKAGDSAPSLLPPFPWVTHPPGPAWAAGGYISIPDWTVEEDWLTETPGDPDPGVIWVTRAPQDERHLHKSAQTPLTHETQKAEDDLRKWGIRSQSEVQLPTTPDPVLSATESWTTSDWNKEEEEEEATTAFPLGSSSTVSRGAWNGWSRLVTSPQRSEDSGITHNDAPTEADLRRRAGEKHLQSDFPQEGSDKKNVSVETTPTPAVPIQPASSPQPPVGRSRGPGENLDPVQTDQEQNHSSLGLLLGLLVPICIFLVVMVALGIVYCTRGAVQPRNQTISECYHWISGAHHKQGGSDPSAGVKSV
uniref:CD248 molecule, endosialin n=2 Tax=Nothobranchius pienaari TaxID=704102 RepID=A0A1A8MUT2_9TELE